MNERKAKIFIEFQEVMEHLMKLFVLTATQIGYHKNPLLFNINGLL